MLDNEIVLDILGCTPSTAKQEKENIEKWAKVMYKGTYTGK